MDPAIEKACANALGHPPPFADAELGSVGELTIEKAKTLDGLERCTGLSALTIFASDVGQLPKLASLRALKLLCLPIEDVTVVGELTKLVELELSFTLVSDLAPLVKLPALRRLRLVGNPLSEESEHQHLPRLKEKAVVVAPDENSAQLARAVASRGFRLSYGGGAGLDFLLVRPGIGSVNEVDFKAVEPSTMQRLLDLKEEHTTESFLGRIFTGPGSKDFLPPGPKNETGIGRFRSPWVVGDAAEALQWIAAAPISDGDKRGLAQFVKRFSALSFYREQPEVFRRRETDDDVVWPEWLKTIRARALAGVAPGQGEVELRFDRFDSASSLRADRVSQIWYRFRPGYSGESRDVLFDDCGLYTIAEWASELRSSLEVSVANPAERRIFEVYVQDLFASKSSKEDPLGIVYPAFESYGSMMAHVVALRIDGKEVAGA
jgi:hypothetical protein